MAAVTKSFSIQISEVPNKETIKSFTIQFASTDCACDHPRQHGIKSQLQRRWKDSVNAPSEKKEDTEKHEGNHDLPNLNPFGKDEGFFIFSNFPNF
ncbi:hypothetical protein MHB45_26865 [Peribacillus sp. FSL K6-5616]|uniref:hypothetical protein n=1 Tax=Peribacillus sp. FSL K6-5616 TaxID=2921508 RepID=UPI0030F5E1CC